MTPPIPEHWANPPRPRPGLVRRWNAWWRDRRYHPRTRAGGNLVNAWVLACWLSYAFPGPVTDAVQILVLYAILVWLVWDVLAPIRAALRLIRSGWRPGDDPPTHDAA